MEASSIYHFDTTPAMDSFMDNHNQEYEPMYFQHNSAPHNASTSQYTGVPFRTQSPTNQLSCIECPGSSFSTPLDLLSHQHQFHWPGEAPFESEASAFSRQSAASLTLPELPSNNDFDGYEYEGNTIQPSQLLVDHSFQPGSLATTYPEYPDLSTFESGENTPLFAPEAPEPGTPASFVPFTAAPDEAAYTDTRFDQAVNTTHTAPFTVDQPWVEQNTTPPTFTGGYAYADPEDPASATFDGTMVDAIPTNSLPVADSAPYAGPPTPRRASLGRGFGSLRPPRVRRSHAAPTPARQPAANRVAKPSSARGVTKPPTVLCSWPGCEKRFSTKQVMETHIEEVHEEIKIPCDHPGCNETCANKENLARHKRSVHDKVTFQCPNVGCTHTSTRRDNLKSRHLPVCRYRTKGDNDSE